MLLLSDNVLKHRLNSESIDFFDMGGDYYDIQKIKLNTIDNVVFSINTKIDLIKLDIEGSELLALKGSIKTIERYSPLLLVVVDHAKEEREEVIRFIRDHFKRYSFTEFTFSSYKNVLFYDSKKHMHRIKRLQIKK